ncbi:CHAP domain-containing protein, partial [Mangrovihabitans endophyticus]|uniref:CHAP domain-containing protein n=1 Tax=Mangrovihabitans endophyticus TaxID=1751298 RepID=UPI0016688E9B
MTITSDHRSRPGRRRRRARLATAAVAATAALVAAAAPASAAVSPGVANRIVAIAHQEMNNGSHNHESGGYNCNYYSGALGAGAACSNGWRSEEWCADFARWVWAQAKVDNTSELTAAAASFYQYGHRHGTWHAGSPSVGDAIVFNLSSDGTYASHVGLVVAVSSSSVTMISGNTYSAKTGTTDSVAQETLSRSDSSISGYTDPLGGAGEPAPENALQSSPVVQYGTQMQVYGRAGNGHAYANV